MIEIDTTLRMPLKGRGFQTPMERLLFAMTANRGLEPSGKFGMEHWVVEKVLIDGLPEMEVHQLCRAMDFLPEATEEIQRDMFSAVAHLFNPEVDLIFMDTTSIHFEIKGRDDGDGNGPRKRGDSKDSRPDLA